MSRWWKEVKALSGVSASSEWWHQMLGETIPTVDALAERFNEFLRDLTSNFILNLLWNSTQSPKSF